MQKHLRLISRKPQVAQNTLEVKLDFIIEFYDRLLLMDRQSAWKYIPTDGGGGSGDTGTGDDTVI